MFYHQHSKKGFKHDQRECLNILVRCKVKDSTLKTENIIYSQLIPSYKANIKRFKQYDQKVNDPEL